MNLLRTSSYRGIALAVILLGVCWAAAARYKIMPIWGSSVPGGVRLTWPRRGSIGNRTRIAFRPDGSLLALTELAEVHQWHSARPWPARPVVSLIPPPIRGGPVSHDMAINGAWGWAWNDDTLTPDGRFALGFDDIAEDCGIWDTTTGALLGHLDLATGRFPVYALSGNGAWMAVRMDGPGLRARPSNVVAVFTLPSGRLVSRRSLDAPPLGLALSMDGRLAAATLTRAVSLSEGQSKSLASMLIIWDTHDGKTLIDRTLPPGGSWARFGRPLFSPSGTEVAVGGNRSVFLIACRSGEIRLVLKGGEARIGRTEPFASFDPSAFSPDGRRLACIAMNRIDVFDPGTGQHISRLRVARNPLLIGDQQPDRVAFSADSQWLAASVELDQSLTVWPVGELKRFDVTAEDTQAATPRPGVVY